MYYPMPQLLEVPKVTKNLLLRFYCQINYAEIYASKDKEIAL